MHELPLLIFTLLVQGSVGLTLFLALAARTAKDAPEAQKQRLPAMLFACIAGGLGLIASTLHLGYPLNAFNALRHIASSWLSREIVFASVYLAVLGFCTLMMLIKKQRFGILLTVAAVLGLIDVWCMSAIYAHSSVITWMHFNTWLMFYGSVGILGAIAFTGLPLLKASQAVSAYQPLIRLTVVTVMMVTVIRLLAQPAYLHYLSSASLNNVVTLPHQPVQAFAELSGLRLLSWVISVMGTALFAISGWRNRRCGLIIGSLLLLVSEVLFRFVFFSIH